MGHRIFTPEEFNSDEYQTPKPHDRKIWLCGSCISKVGYEALDLIPDGLNLFVCLDVNVIPPTYAPCSGCKVKPDNRKRSLHAAILTRPAWRSPTPAKVWT